MCGLGTRRTAFSTGSGGASVTTSAGSAIAAIRQKLPDLPAGSRILGFNYDTGERYLSVPDFLPEA